MKKLCWIAVVLICINLSAQSRNSGYANIKGNLDTVNLSGDTILHDVYNKRTDSSTMGIEEYKTEEQSYFYAFPPFPLPAVNQIRSLIYWNTGIDIDKDEIAIYDLYGTKISGREQIDIEKITPYSGYLTWNCSWVDSGIYLIQIRHGASNNVIKVIVTR